MPLSSDGEMRKGSYVLVLRLEKSRRLSVGKLGTFDFPPGYYLYFGSALNGLEGRISRHLRHKTKRHWHIDFLTAVAAVAQVWWTADERRWECAWLKAALGQQGAAAPVAGFGSSDCRCRTHLVRVSAWADVEALHRAVAPESATVACSHWEVPTKPRRMG